MAQKEATARIKINKLLEEAGWRFFESAAGPANIVLEPQVRLTGPQVTALGNTLRVPVRDSSTSYYSTGEVPLWWYWKPRPRISTR